MDIVSRVQDLSLDKFCCAQIVMKIGLEYLGRDNQDLIQAMKGLCMGTHTQDQCGTLSGAACMLALFAPEQVHVLVQELTGWFEDKFKTTSCYDILTENNNNLSGCMSIVAETCQQCFELLEKHNLLPEPD